MVGRATRYLLDELGFEFQWGATIFVLVQTGPEVHPTSSTRGALSFPGVKRKWPGADHPPSSSAEVAEGLARSVPT